MNLVAKEYVACRSDLGGALVLSEFTGAAAELRQAYLANPHHLEGVKDAIEAALNRHRKRAGDGCAPCAGRSSPTTSTAGRGRSSTRWHRLGDDGNQMKVAVFERFGGPEVLEFVDSPSPIRPTTRS